MNPFIKIWFWLLILSIIGFILSFIFFETMGQTESGEISPPGWIWIIFVLSIIFFIVAFILYVVDIVAYYHDMEIAEACSECPPELETEVIEYIEKKVVECPPPKKIECPPPKKIECPPKKIECPPPKKIECPPPKKKCVEKKIIEYIDEPASVVVQPVKRDVIIAATSEEAFSAANLKDLSSLAPIE